MKFKVKQAEFVRAITKASQAPPFRPAVVFAGRSNVGKSSLINKLTGKRSLARTSSTPGRTREIIYFDIDDRFYFIDLPGYGYAKVSAAVQRQWAPMMNTFFHDADGIRLTVVILDVRREPTEVDYRLVAMLQECAIPFIFAVTKCDKLSRSATMKRLKEIQAALGVDEDALVPVSAETGQGIGDLLAVIGSVLHSPGASVRDA
ncbi:ribosome biogenesis GTP-binding protein YihA/YsxC [bacterium]|nr:ribosome biogenesis GTP-binding protein YihA/YsxC [bacterium]